MALRAGCPAPRRAGRRAARLRSAPRSCSTTSRPARELRLLRRFEPGLLLAASLQLFNRVEAAIEQLLLAALARHALAQSRRRLLVDAVIVIQHNAIALRARARDQACFHIELDQCS